MTEHAGRLVYVVGPSGAGKNTVIASAKEKFFKIKYLWFSPRYVTRAVNVNDDDDEPGISARAFDHYQQMGLFALDWEAHGLRYGVSVAIDRQLQIGRTVVVNGSRAHVETALQRYPRMTVVQITVPPRVAHARLALRGREDGATIAAGVERVPAFQVPDAQFVCIDNSGALDAAVQSFAAVLLRDGEWRLHDFPRRAALR